MSKFITVHPVSGKDMLVNVDHIVFVQAFEDGITEISLIESRGFRVKGTYDEIVGLIRN